VRFVSDLVLGICNGFQILCEWGLLPGILMCNANLALLLGRAALPPAR
jgi:phosphoribosylformylglycinamidine synthase